MRFRKRPIIIEAMRVPQGTSDDAVYMWGRIAHWLGPGGGWRLNDQHGIDIDTLEGTMRADPGDWVVRGVKGELYPIKDDILRETYDLIGDEP